jgi:hypothetical protein
VLVSTWYRPPDSNIELLECFENFLKKLDDENKEIIITGDFNCDLLKKDYVNPNIKMMKDLIDIYQLQQHIDKPSRTTNYSQTLIDLILTKIEDNKTIDSGVIELGISDHSLVYIQLFQLRLSPEQSGKVEYERERLLGIANKFIHLLAIPSSLSRSYSTFPLCSGDNLN